MKFECAWCGLKMPDTVYSETNSIEDTISHSICIPCMAEMEIFDEVNMEKIPDTILNHLPFGTAVLNYEDIIQEFTTSEDNLTDEESIECVRKIIGSDYFKEVVPFVRTRSLGYTIGGLKRRKNRGVHENHYIFRYKDKVQFVELTITHNPNNKLTTVCFNLIREQSLKGKTPLKPIEREIKQ